MNQGIRWLAGDDSADWTALSEALRAGLPVPNGFVVSREAPEGEIRTGYEELKIREKTHFVAVRGATHAVLNTIGPDTLIHTIRRFRAETPAASILVQRMVHASWSGKAHRTERGVIIKANEGMMVFEPDTCVMTDGQCIDRQIQVSQRKMIRHVDGSSKTFEMKNRTEGMSEAQLKSVVDLAQRAQAGIAWALDDQDRVWLISVESR